MDYIEMGKLQSHPNDLIEATIIKEFLIGEQMKMRKEINDETKRAEENKIPQYIINIFKDKLEERKRLIDHLLKEAIDEFWRIKDEYKIV